MRKSFSERYGFKKIRDSFQIESMDDGLRNRLWNRIHHAYIEENYSRCVTSDGHGHLISIDFENNYVEENYIF